MSTFLRLALLCWLFCLAHLSATAQAIVNGGFETWATRNGADAPTGWLTTDDVVAAALGLPLATGTYSKTTDAHSGTYAVRLETKASLAGALPGAVGTGTKVGTSALPGGTPFTARPATLQFYYKLSGTQPAVASNGAFVQLALTRTVGGSVQTIATARQQLTTVTATYALVQVPLAYASSATPDSLRLAFSSGIIPTAAGGTPTVGTVLQVDDVSLLGTVTAAREAALSAALSVFPNPSPSGQFVLRATPALLAATLTVVDATGRVVWSEPAPAQPAATRTLHLAGLASGLYTLQLLTPEGLITKKLLL